MRQAGKPGQPGTCEPAYFITCCGRTDRRSLGHFVATLTWPISSRPFPGAAKGRNFFQTWTQFCSPFQFYPLFFLPCRKFDIDYIMKVIFQHGDNNITIRRVKLLVSLTT
jgi:hypothetical protein